MRKTQTIVVNGMDQDSNPVLLNGKAREIINMRLTNDHSLNDTGTADSWVTISGNHKLYYDEGNLKISNIDNTSDVIILGTAVLNSTLIVFFIENDKDCISLYTFNKEGEVESAMDFYSGDLNFDKDHPIEATVYYENENVQKVYWVDGLNPLRYANIAQDSSYYQNKKNPFDAIRTLELNETCSVSWQVSGGNFSPGVVQYFCTYYDMNGSETAPFWQSKQMYVTDGNRGIPADSTCACSFKITLNTTDSNFDYVKLYCIQYTTLNGIPSARLVIDTPREDSMTLIDNGIIGSAVNPSDLYYIGGDIIIGNTLAQKNNTLFLGNYSTPSYDLYFDIKEKIDGIYSNKKGIDVKSSTLYYTGSSSDFYSYTNILKYGQSIKRFKYKEWYRLGIQFQDNYGRWSNVVYIGDVQNTQKPTISSTSQTSGNFKLSDAYFNAIYTCIMQTNSGKDIIYKKARPVIALPDDSNRSCIAQGIVCPTVFNIGDRASDSPFAMSSWFSRPVVKHDISSGYAGYLIKNGASESFTPSRSPDDNRLTYFVPTGWGIQYSVRTSTALNIANITCNIINVSYTKNKKRTDVSKYIRFDDIIFPKIEGKDPDDAYNEYWAIDNTSMIPNRGVPYGVYNMANNNLINGLKIISKQVTSGDYVTSNFANTSSLDNYRTWAEFRHLYPIPGNIGANAEIQSLLWPPDIWNYSNSDNLLTEYFYIDQNICTLHSPDIEWSSSTMSTINTDQLNFRFIGYAQVDSSTDSIYIEDTNGTAYIPSFEYISHDESRLGDPDDCLPNAIGDSVDRTLGLRISSGTQTNSDEAWKSLLAAPIWRDVPVHTYAQAIYGQKGGTGQDNHFVWGGYWKSGTDNLKEDANKYGIHNFVVYPWHKTGSLNNNEGTGGTSSYSKKQLSNLKISNTTTYLTDIWSQEKVSVACWDGSYTSNNIVKLQAYKQGSSHSVTYKGSIIKNVVPSYPYFPVVEPNMLFSSREKESLLPLPSNVATYDDYLQAASTDETSYWHSSINTRCWDIYVAGGAYRGGNDDPLSYLLGVTNTIAKTTQALPGSKAAFNTPVEIKYSSSSHAALCLGVESGKNVIFPSPTTSSLNFSDSTNLSCTTYSGTSYTYTPILSTSSAPVSTNRGFYWIGELYRDMTADTFMSGTSANILASHQWIVAGEAVSVDSGSTFKNITWSYGDTYLSRYDHVKTKPYSSSDLNQVTEVVSFLVESRVNLDARTDRNRGLTDNTLISDTNFNLRNPVYDQMNTFFTYSYLNADLNYATYFPNGIVYSQTKSPGSSIDAYTSITASNTAYLDGDKGSLNKLINWKDNIIAFQDTGFALVNFNSTSALSTDSGIPLVIGNSGKFEGVKYVSTNVGTTNKYSVLDSEEGVYFIDDLNKDIYVYGLEGLVSLSDKLGMRTWCQERDLSEVRTFKDKVNSEIIFSCKSGNKSLVYSELNKVFTSFYHKYSQYYLANYDNINGYAYCINKKDLYFYRFNDPTSNTLFGDTYYTRFIFISNGFEQVYNNRDKIFDNIELRAENIDDEKVLDSLVFPFDYIRVFNHYQDSGKKYLKSNTISDGSKQKNGTSSGGNNLVRKKFRVWRINIPRDMTCKMDRMRDSWLYIELQKDEGRMILYNMEVKYFEN